MSTYETVQDRSQTQRQNYAPAHAVTRNLTDGYMRSLDFAVAAVSALMLLGPLATAAFGPMN